MLAGVLATLLTSVHLCFRGCFEKELNLWRKIFNIKSEAYSESCQASQTEPLEKVESSFKVVDFCFPEDIYNFFGTALFQTTSKEHTLHLGICQEIILFPCSHFLVNYELPSYSKTFGTLVYFDILLTDVWFIVYEVFLWKLYGYLIFHQKKFW